MTGSVCLVLLSASAWAEPVRERAVRGQLAAFRASRSALHNPGRLSQLFDAGRGQAWLDVGPEAPARGEARHPILVVPEIRRVPAAYRRTFRVLAGRPEETDRYDELILVQARASGLDARLVKAIVAAESEFNPAAVSPKGARGLMQVLPSTAEEVGVSGGVLRDPEANLRAGAGYLRRLFELAWRRFRLMGESFDRAPLWVVQRVIAAYHAGPRFLVGPDWYRSTRSYVRKVLLYYQSRITDIRRPARPRGDLPEIGFMPEPGLLP